MSERILISEEPNATPKARFKAFLEGTGIFISGPTREAAVAALKAHYESRPAIMQEVAGREKIL